MAEVHIWKSSLVSRRLWPFLEYLYGRSAPVRSARIIQHLQFSSSLVRARALIKGLATGEEKVPRLTSIQPEYSKGGNSSTTRKSSKIQKYKITKIQNSGKTRKRWLRLRWDLWRWVCIPGSISTITSRKLDSDSRISLPGISLEIWAFYLRPTSLHCTFGIW